MNKLAKLESTSNLRNALSIAVTTLDELCFRIDEGEDPTAAVAALFKETQLDVVEAIDYRKAVVAAMKGYIEHGKAAREEIAAHIAKLELAVEALKASTKAIIEAHPDLPYRDSLGRKLYIAKNSGAALKLGFDITESKSFSKIVSLETMTLFDIPPEYIELVSFHVLDTAAVKADLEAGKELPWAKLERGTHIRGL